MVLRAQLLSDISRDLMAIHPWSSQHLCKGELYVFWPARCHGEPCRAVWRKLMKLARVGTPTIATFPSTEIPLMAAQYAHYVCCHSSTSWGAAYHWQWDSAHFSCLARLPAFGFDSVFQSPTFCPLKGTGCYRSGDVRVGERTLLAWTSTL